MLYFSLTFCLLADFFLFFFINILEMITKNDTDYFNIKSNTIYFLLKSCHTRINMSYFCAKPKIPAILSSKNNLICYHKDIIEHEVAQGKDKSVCLLSAITEKTFPKNIQCDLFLWCSAHFY